MIVPLVILLSLTFGCQQGEEVTEEARPVVDVEADINALKGMLRQYAAHANAGDLEQWMSLWADDGVRMPPDSPARIGKEQIREEIEPAFEQMILDLTITNIWNVEVYGDLGIIRCNYTLDATPKAGGETIHVMRDGKALSVWKRQSDGSWKIIRDCFNSNVPSTSE
jgi:uncharacterized protein (TIGR02246 family)